MSDHPNVLKVNIYGTDYPIKGDTDTEYIQRVASYVDGKMREVERASSVKSALKVAILAALNIADELFQERLGKKSLPADVATRLQKLSDTLRESLQETSERPMKE